MDRKKFIKRTLGAIGAFTIVPRHVLGGNGYTAPSDQLTRAIIGVGGMGRGHLRYPGARLVALCDVEQLHLDRALGMVERGVRSYSDYREVLEQDDIDIVHIVTPPIWHGKMAVDAATTGQVVCMDKALSHTT